MRVLWALGLLASLQACGSLQKNAAKDPMKCERDPSCAGRSDKSADCVTQCADNIDCIDRCRSVTGQRD